VELLIVIALIAILSVAVLATINPIEQANKAKDATVQNDAAEVLNAYERFYAAQASYPWVDLSAGNLTVDSAAYMNSTQIGFGLCASNVVGAEYDDQCAPRNSQGLLLSTTELKDSFLEKNYTKLATNLLNPPAFTDMLYTVKDPVAQGNSIHVCFIPKAKANRTVNSKLKLLGVGAAGVPTQYADADITDATQFANGYSVWTFTTAATSMFKCVP
jgi:type II secretory pathway pseudopilin PulG